MKTTLGARTLSDLKQSVDPELVKTLINFDFGVLGRTASTPDHPNTSGRFHFWLSKEAAEAHAIDIGSLVVAFSDDEREVVFGAVNELNSVCESNTFTQDYNEHSYGSPVQGASDHSEVIVATCAVVQTLSSKTRPVTRSLVYFPTSLGIQFAFGIVDTKGAIAFHGAAIPVGIYENADGTIAPVSIDENYLVGPEAAHLNISGISGLACKTSALEFCLKSLLTHTTKKIGVVVLNVKSKDLLYLDQSNTRLLNDAWSRKVYETLGMPIEGFTVARFFAPSHPRHRSGTQSLRELTIEPFRWDLNMLYQELPALFNSSEWDNNTEGAWYAIKEEIERGTILSYEGMIGWIDKLLQQSGLTEWPRGFPTATWHKLKADLRRFTVQYRGLIAEEAEGNDIPWDDLRANNIFVVDIQMLSDGGQKLVFGHCIRHITQLLETRSTRLDSIIVFVDELNKFAPKDYHTELKAHLVDVTARGRSLGLVLFGAEQFASAVEKQIVENSSTFMFGRTESTEMETATYTGLTEEMKAKLRMLPQGQLLIKFPKFPQPIFVRFPYPPGLPGEDFRSSAQLAAAHAEAASKFGDGEAPAPSPENLRPAIYSTSPPVLRSSPSEFLRRYRDGDREAVWTELVSLKQRVRDPEYFEDAYSVARETMRRARQNVETLIQRLDQMNYHFYSRTGVLLPEESTRPAPSSKDTSLGAMKQIFEDLRKSGRQYGASSVNHLQDRNVFLPPTEKDAAIIQKLERQGIFVPLSLRAWLEEVGRVDFTGSHPTLCYMQDPDSSGASILVYGQDGRKTQHMLRRAITMIGRTSAAGNDIALPGDDRVSKQHARIERDRENRFTVHDMGSTNGVKVNGVRIDQRRELTSGDELTVGATKILFQQAADRGVREDISSVAGIFADPLAVIPTAAGIQWRIEQRRSQTAPLDLFISPYDADKAAPDPDELIEEGYTITLPNMAADTLLTGERHSGLFLDYLRRAFTWGGFPGWERYKNHPSSELEFLTEGLLPI
ncbi:MAG: FHA domain-containing protein [Capsulimonadaceae bacterium]